MDKTKIISGQIAAFWLFQMLAAASDTTGRSQIVAPTGLTHIKVLSLTPEMTECGHLLMNYSIEVPEEYDESQNLFCLRYNIPD